ncbi:MAG: orotidine-5'-phosphate decarboxylase [Rhodobacteraceae bacterium]|nr:orotidine-5'-phosphate decarboxylase [Paracoccaceae bacterium]
MADDRLIIALDVPNIVGGLELADRLGDAVSFYKVGLGMLTGGGFALANELKGRGKRVFLDMKLFDIGTTVERAVAGIAAQEIDFLTVHGDPPVVRAAVAGRGDRPMRLLAVTILTDLDRADLDACMITGGTLHRLVIERARRALAAGADGVIAPPKQAAALRALPGAAGKLIVTPGVRPSGAAPGEHRRVATPADAIGAGADHIVVGRPVICADDPVAAVRAITKNLATPRVQGASGR